MNRLIILAIFLSVTSLLNCTKFNDSSDTIDVRYEFINPTKLINWTLNDGKNTYIIQFDYNYITTENKINELKNNQIVDSMNIISEDNQVKAYNELIRHNYHPLKETTTINNYKIKDLVVSNELHYYWTERNNFTMPYEY